MEEHAQNQNQAAATDLPESKSLHYRLGPSVRIYRRKSITLNLTEGLSKALNEIMKETDYLPDEIFARALLLYKAALDADRAGKRLVILDSEDEIEQEVINL